MNHDPERLKNSRIDMLANTKIRIIAAILAGNLISFLISLILPKSIISPMIGTLAAVYIANPGKTKAAALLGACIAIPYALFSLPQSLVSFPIINSATDVLAIIISLTFGMLLMGIFGAALGYGAFKLLALFKRGGFIS